MIQFVSSRSTSTSAAASTVVSSNWQILLNNAAVAAPWRGIYVHSKIASKGSTFVRTLACLRACPSQPAMERHIEADPGMGLPALAWKRRLDTPVVELTEFKPTLREILEMLPMGVRLWKFCRSEHEQGRRAPIDPFYPQDTPASSCQGVPLGGIGGGSIGRGFRGDFSRWQLLPTVCQTSAVLADQFSVFITRHSKDGTTQKTSSVLFPGEPVFESKETESGISSWNWNLTGVKSTYYGLFPRAWTTYDGEPDPQMKITCRQVSPFVPHNYKESSFPSCVFIYELVNTGDEDATATLLFTWANSIAGGSETSGGHENSPFMEEDGVRGVLLHHRKEEHSVTFAIAARETDDVSTSVCPCFLVAGSPEGNSYQTAKDMWSEITEKGCFNAKNSTMSASLSQPETVVGAAVAASVVVPAHGTKSITFGLAWDSPKATFLGGSSYYRRYTKFYGKSGNAASKLVHDAILNYKRWESEIHAWQEPILNDHSLPEWYRYTLFNELYYLVAGGTIWTDTCRQACLAQKLNPVKSNGVSEALLDAINANSEAQSFWSIGIPAVEDNVGQFLYLEGVEYHFWNTYDVHFYASYALLALFPRLELQLQRDFAAATLSHDPEKMFYLAYGNTGIRAVFGSVPHDLGTHDPWNTLNSYNLHDTSKWKDLNCKFVVQVNRDAAATGDLEFARAVWPAAYAAMAVTDQFDRDGDGMIENDGVPDQTYDLWTVDGVSSYCGGLWVAALQAASALADLVGDKPSSRMFHGKFLRAKAVYEKSLWNGSYFHYDKNSTSVQSDQLAGQWYSLASGLPGIVREDQATSALGTVFATNVMRYKGGNEGAVNGMLPSGGEDRTSLQSREVWAGTTYAVAAAMIQQGMREEGFRTAKGVFLNGWSDQGHGYAFQTPEAWDNDGKYRSLAYMRPLSIWAMQWALDPPEQLKQRSCSVEVGDITAQEVEACNKSFAKLASQLKELSPPEAKAYSSVWIWMFDYIRSRVYPRG
ncbi:non-lysosomal glucosylceramidase isoform X2 [Selaginella moellendorffii]|uniref:non-lysosomal glucosylceramidase isoform X2 n=1 Tax=Selaginella moellendorffii TaxID=88036 RepID=UPI000D1CB084|nr:non-lysosomal glucosylceramidase isoform X2 [Selaginella moellendorffii]|eukprot:XP_024524629.1 non-lysosomal glucosylceramidase isoform X2 [Selaginella moellendorffii]